MRTFRQLALVAGSVLISGGLAVGQARLGPYIVDSNGLKVGHAKESGTALMFIDNDPVQIPTGRSGFKPESYNLYFTDGACGGLALMDAGGADVLWGPGRYTTDGVIRYVSPGAISVVPLLSALTVQTDGTFSACGPSSPDIAVGAATAVSALAFTPPFEVVDALPVSPAPGTATFNDVPTNHPFFQYIEALAASGITGGCNASPPLYCPDNPTTRGQMAVFLAKALGL